MNFNSLRMIIKWFNIKYKNDMEQSGIFEKIPWVPKGDGDRYRTAAAQINFGPFSIGTNMVTGDVGPNRMDTTNHPEVAVEHYIKINKRKYE
jgi:hypothetical protein